ncbi:MAG: hypothetical protein MZV65_33680 [Chromatiales bacterium]|nr:hypothetical protein [Chromatiales bacterium]
MPETGAETGAGRTEGMSERAPALRSTSIKPAIAATRCSHRMVVSFAKSSKLSYAARHGRSLRRAACDSCNNRGVNASGHRYSRIGTQDGAVTRARASGPRCRAESARLSVLRGPTVRGLSTRSGGIANWARNHHRAAS